MVPAKDPPSSQSPFPEEAETDGTFSDKTWPRSSTARLLAKSLNQQDESESSDANPSPKSEGTPTRNEHIGSIEERVGEERSLGSSGEYPMSPSPGHTLHSNSDSLLAPKNHTLSTQPNTPQYCIRLSGVETPLDKGGSTGTPNGRPGVRSESTELLMLSSGLRHTGSETTPPSTCSDGTGHSNIMHCNIKATPAIEDSSSLYVPRSKSIAHKPAKLGQDDVDGISSYISRMKRMGHRRASSAPIKKFANSSTRQLEEGEGEVFLSPGRGESGGPANRGRQMVSGGGEGQQGETDG